MLDPDSKETLVSQKGPANKSLKLKVSKPKLWSPETPVLYPITARVGEDSVRSYPGVRTISRGVVNGVKRPLLNEQPTFILGTLDQGYWPDGIYTAPTYEAMLYDLHVLKSLGFNTVRKHVRYSPSSFSVRLLLGCPINLQGAR